MAHSYSVTEKGHKIAEDVYKRFTSGNETLEEIAASHGMEPQMIPILMKMVFNGGKGEFDFTDESGGVE